MCVARTETASRDDPKINQRKFQLHQATLFRVEPCAKPFDSNLSVGASCTLATGRTAGPAVPSSRKEAGYPHGARFAARLSGYEPSVLKGSSAGAGTATAAAIRPRCWTGYTPAGQRLIVDRDDDAWVVTRDDCAPVRNVVLDVALVEALRSDVEAHWGGIEPATWMRLIAGSILSTRRETPERAGGVLPVFHEQPEPLANPLPGST